MVLAQIRSFSKVLIAFAGEDVNMRWSYKYNIMSILVKALSPIIFFEHSATITMLFFFLFFFKYSNRIINQNETPVLRNVILQIMFMCIVTS